MGSTDNTPVQGGTSEAIPKVIIGVMVGSYLMMGLIIFWLDSENEDLKEEINSGEIVCMQDAPLYYDTDGFIYNEEKYAEVR
jgi:hypothetical protein